MSGMEATRATAREVLRRPVVQDVLLALAFGIFSMLSLWNPPTIAGLDFREADAFGSVVVVVASVAIGLRSVRPVAAVLLALAASLVLTQMAYSQSLTGLGALLTLYSVSVSRSLRISLTLAALTLAAVGVVIVTSPFDATVSDWFANLFVISTAWILGRSVRVRRAHSASLEDRNRAQAAAQEAETRSRLLEARTQMAREMQDLVAHNLTEINVQIAAARRLVARDPETAEEVLLAAEASGRAAMEEMRRVVGMLNQPEEAQLRPQPGLEDLRELVEKERAAGARITVVTEGEAALVPPGVALAAYRVVEEALVNARRHAEGTPVEVSVTWAETGLSLEVGSGAASTRPHWEGSTAESAGALGRLRNRVAVYGGTLTWGRRRDGGFRVAARFPIHASTGAR